MRQLTFKNALSSWHSAKTRQYSLRAYYSGLLKCGNEFTDEINVIDNEYNKIIRRIENMKIEV